MSVAAGLSVLPDSFINDVILTDHPPLTLPPARRAVAQPPAAGHSADLHRRDVLQVGGREVLEETFIIM